MTLPWYRQASADNHYVQELYRFHGIVITMLYKDAMQNNKPYVHVTYGDSVACIGIDGELLDGKIPRQLVKYLKAWLLLRRDELYKAWGNVLNDTDPGKIQP